METTKAIALFDIGTFYGCYWQSSDGANLWNGFRRSDNSLFAHTTGDWAKTETEIISWIEETI